VNHGLQLWAALPRELEEVEPSFAHTRADDIPELVVDGATVRVLIGEAFGRKSPVATFSPTLYLDVELPAGTSLQLPPVCAEMAVYAVDGDLVVDGNTQAALTMAVLTAGAASTLSAPDGPARFVVIGGDALDAPRHMWWNFVSSRKERIVQAADDWEAGRFAPVPGETEFIPLPERHFT
jgi:redox-sensitive bicupin YhaK (pirin superfamily)